MFVSGPLLSGPPDLLSEVLSHKHRPFAADVGHELCRSSRGDQPYEVMDGNYSPETNSRPPPGVMETNTSPSNHHGNKRDEHKGDGPSQSMFGFSLLNSGQRKHKVYPQETLR